MLNLADMLDDENNKKTKILQSVPFFKDFTEEELKYLLQHSSWKRYDAGDVLFREGDIERSFYVILKGAVDVMKKPPHSLIKKTITRLAFGECFGEMSVVTGQPRNADVVAAQETYVLKIDSKTLLVDHNDCMLLKIQFKFCRLFCQTLANRLNKVDSELVRIL